MRALFSFLLIVGGCTTFDSFDDVAFGTGGEMALENCIDVPNPIVDFGEVTLGTGPATQMATLIDACGIISSMGWSLDDPDNAFAFEWANASAVKFTVTASTAGKWEAQFTGDGQKEFPDVTLQLFAETVASAGGS